LFSNDVLARLSLTFAKHDQAGVNVNYLYGKENTHLEQPQLKLLENADNRLKQIPCKL